MNIIITGGSGFLGSKLAEKFLQKKHSVTVLDFKKTISSNLQQIILNL